MKQILQTLLRHMEEGRDCMLVTLVGHRGSAPRGTGAQMLVGHDGRLAGTIGGGSVEKTAGELAAALLKQKQSQLREFPLHPDSPGDIGMICGGAVKAWFQYVPAEDPAWMDVTSRALDCFRELRPAWFVQDLRGGSPSLVLEETLLPSREECFALPLPLGERVVIFGGGHIARALTPLLRGVGFRPVIFECRPEYAKPEDFPAAEAVVLGDYLCIDQYLPIEEADYIVVMTNGHAFDFEIQKQLLHRQLAYIGVIGSRKKTAALNQRLLEAGIPEEAIRQVHAPIGTAIKAVTPAEIAVSIAGELILERANKREEAPHTCPMG